MYWGKIIGGLLGLASGRWYLLVAGLLLGHQFDRGFARFSRGAIAGATGDADIEPVFAVMGHIAKSDGLVTEAEIRAARSAMHSLKLDAGGIREAIDAFTRGKAANYPLHKVVSNFANAHRDEASRLAFLKLQLAAAIDAGPLGQPAREKLWAVSRGLGFNRVEFAQLEAVLRAQRGFARSAAGQADTQRLTEAYAALGIDDSASDDEVKRAYRRLMNRIHPDKLSGRDASEAALAEAARRSSEASAAYELIRKRRGLRTG